MSSPTPIFRLRKHGDYQRVYKASRKQFSKQIAYFFASRPSTGPDGAPLRNATPGAPRIGLTVPKALGKAVDRNRIKRRMREAVRASLSELALPVDVILHPRRTVITQPFLELQRDVAAIFRTIQRSAQKPRPSPPQPPGAPSKTDRGESELGIPNP